MLKATRLTCVDLFAGCGGLSLGLRSAGFDTLLFSELNRHAADTFQANLGKASLIRIGDIADLSDKKLNEIQKDWSAKGITVDLVTGGPPCQGYSGIGHRRTHAIDRADVPANHLFRHMIRVIERLQPKAFLFENVRGLLTGRWRPNGKSGEIWEEVRQAFEEIDGYEVGWDLIHAYDFGVPQNRPRIILVGVRKDLGVRVSKSDRSNTVHNPRGLIPNRRESPPNIRDAIGDLVDTSFHRGKRATENYPRKAQTKFQRRARQTRHGKQIATGNLLTEMEYSMHSERVVARFDSLRGINAEGQTTAPKTKKFAQRVLPVTWNNERPSITVTSLPDDFVHYGQSRILTVREWARLQTFPDWFSFTGPRTTGGSRRAGRPLDGIWERELPKYTQIGNAVPVRLGYWLGKHVKELLRSSRRRTKHTTPTKRKKKSVRQ